MDLFIITEYVEFKSGLTMMTTNNHVKGTTEAAFNVFETRSNMLMSSKSMVKILKQQMNQEEGWGFTKVEMENGMKIEIGITKAYLV